MLSLCCSAGTFTVRIFVTDDQGKAEVPRRGEKSHQKLTITIDKDKDKYKGKDKGKDKAEVLGRVEKRHPTGQLCQLKTFELKV